MINNIFMSILLLGLAAIIFLKAKIINDEKWFMSIEYTKALKGIMCIIVILVHIPKIYSNMVQDTIGSFAYVCVTLFFLFSSYGLMYSLENKKDYLKTFWKKRILVLFIPYLIVNIINTALFHENANAITIILKGLGLNDVNFITVLIFFYIIFYLIGVIVKNKKVRNILLISFPIIYSIVNYFLGIDKWGIEGLGFSYGFILYLIFDKYRVILSEKNIRKSICKYIFGVLICAILGFTYLKLKTVYFFGEYLLKILLGVSIILLVFEITNKIKIGNKILWFLGSISYEIYLLHRLIIALTAKIPGLNSWQFIYIVICITIISAYVLNIIDKKIISKLKGE